MLSNRDFQLFVNPNSHASQLVIMHMLIIDFVMSTTAALENGKNRTKDHRKDHSKDASRVWIQQMINVLPADHRYYAEWPVKLLTSLGFFEEDQIREPSLLIGGTAALIETSERSPHKWQN